MCGSQYHPCLAASIRVMHACVAHVKLDIRHAKKSTSVGDKAMIHGKQGDAAWCHAKMPHICKVMN